MSQKLLEAVAQNTRYRVVTLLKRAEGMSVQELADHLDMSYMGVKEVCVALERKHLVECFREPKPSGTTGRPRMLYRLSERAQCLFPAASNGLTLELLHAAKKLHGPTAAERMLLVTWQEKTERYRSQMREESLRGRALEFAVLRDKEGNMSVISETAGLRIVEYHCPVADLIREYPIISTLEQSLVRNVLEAPVDRVERMINGVGVVEFITR